MIAKKLNRLVALLVIFCTFAIHALGQQTPVPPPKKLNKIVYDGDMAALLAHLAAQYKVNIGFETDPPELKPKIKIDAWFNSLEDLLDAIVHAVPRYKWRNQDGFIDIYPQAASCPLLDTVINDFQVSGSDWGEASRALTNLPEVQSQMEIMRVRRHDFDTISRGTEASRFSLRLENVTVRRALHEIAKRSGNGFRIFQRHGSRGHLISVNNSM